MMNAAVWREWRDVYRVWRACCNVFGSCLSDALIDGAY